MVRAHFCWTMRRDRDEIARARKEREEKEACRRSRTTQDSFWPGWSPVNLLLMPLSAQISSNDVLGPPFPLPFSSFPFLFCSFSCVFFSSFSFSLLSSAEHHARNGRSLFCSSLYTRDTNATERRKGDAHIAVKVNEKKGGRVRPDVSQSLREDHLENCCLSSSTEIVAPFGSCSTPYRRSSASQSQQATVSRWSWFSSWFWWLQVAKSYLRRDLSI